MMMNLTINEIPISVPAGTTILTAAKRNGIKIPTFCYHSQMLPLGACRVCLVEVEKMAKLQTACSTAVAEGMVVKTKSSAAVKAQQGVIEFLLLNHPLDCPVCDKGGECELQDLTFRYGPQASRNIFPRHKHERYNIGPLIVRDQNRCIQCKRCVRICQEYHGKSCLGTINRGFYAEIASFNFESTTCDFCGDCIEVCPVGALTNRAFRFKERVWNLNRVETTCPYCADGCRINIESRETQIKRVRPRRLTDEYVSDTHLCVRGYFGFHFVNHPDRIKTPLLKKNGQLIPVDWNEAFATVANRFTEIKKANGADAIAGLGSARCSNEENYLFQKFMRATLGTNNVDYLITNRGSEWNELWLNSIPQSISFDEIKTAKTILIIGADFSVQNPVLGLNIRQAVMHNQASLIELNPAPTELQRFTTHQLLCRPGTELAGVTVLNKLLVSKNIVDFKELALEVDGIPEYQSWLNQLSYDQLLQESGLDNNLLADAVEQLSHPQSVILFGREVIEHPHRNLLITALTNLATLLGKRTKLLPIFEYANSRGAIDMGVVPFLYPGYQKVEDPPARIKFEKLWNGSLPQRVGFNFKQMLDSAGTGSLKALYIMGENPVVRFPDRKIVETALDNLEFFVVQDLFLTETARYADVIFPAASFAEKSGTFTNTEGRVQHLTPAFDPLGDSKPDWWILTELANRLEAGWVYKQPIDILDEITQVVPLYKSVDSGSLVSNAEQLPVYEPFPYISQTTDLFGKKKKIYIPETISPPSVPLPDYPLRLITGNVLAHSGSLSHWAKVLNEISPAAKVGINPADARTLNIQPDELVKVESKKGSIILKADINKHIALGTIFIPQNFPDTPVNKLMDINELIAWVKLTKIR
jgi:formate dehydrogenase alpha subunit